MCGNGAKQSVSGAKAIASHQQPALAPRATLLLAMVWLACSPAILRAAELIRLPPVRLPQVETQLRSGAETVAEGDIVRLAGGAVELRVRQGWWIWEIPRGREVRVALSPVRPQSLRSVPVPGYWLAFHLELAPPADSRQALAAFMRQRLLEVTGGRAEPQSAVQFQRLGPWDAAELEFSLPVTNGGRTTVTQGSHVLVQTPWGLFEFHAEFPADRYHEQLRETAALLQHLTLSAPASDDAGPTTSTTRAATPILGSWKSFRGRLRLTGSGGIEIAPDRPQLISPPAEAPAGHPTPSGQDLLQGHFRADDDLLFVQWRDGSKLNFRWKLSGGDLLLTDHAGQISQLRRLAE